MVHLCFFFNDTATTEIYTLSLHDALPISAKNALHNMLLKEFILRFAKRFLLERKGESVWQNARSEEHTSELQSPDHLVCRLLLEKKKHWISYRDGPLSSRMSALTGFQQYN